jgi:hypothetical protein
MNLIGAGFQRFLWNFPIPVIHQLSGAEKPAI